MLAVDFLIEVGADVHVQRDLPLKVACVNDHPSVVYRLLEAGADPRPAMDWLHETGRPDASNLLRATHRQWLARKLDDAISELPDIETNGGEHDNHEKPPGIGL